MSDDVFAAVVRDHRPALRDAALHAAFKLGVFEGGEVATTPRLRALTDVLVLEGALKRDGGRLVPAIVPPRPAPPPPFGFGRLADVLRSGRPLPTEAHTADLHRHLAEVGAAAARALVAQRLVPGPRLLDIGGGAGAYTTAWLEASPAHAATLVDLPPVVALARERLPEARVSFIEGDALEAPLGDGYDGALLANVLHLHGPEVCAALVARAAEAVRHGGVVLIKDLRIAPDRSGPPTALYFALSMALYTEAGDVWEAERIAGWLSDAGLVDVEARDLSDGATIVFGQRT